MARLDSEGRVEKIKEAMSEWVDQAREKAPCLLVLDGLDPLIAPQNEVSSSALYIALEIADGLVVILA